MQLIARSPHEYLASDAIIESDSAAVCELAAELRGANSEPVAFAQAAFEWVRDEVAHSVDAGDRAVTLSATEVLSKRVGLCFAKAHLLTALLRAQRVPAGLCYQRLTDGTGHVLHGLVAVHLGGAWHRQDPRGNTGTINAQFSLEREQLAYAVSPALGELDYPMIRVAPATAVVDALRGAADALELCASGLPGTLD